QTWSRIKSNKFVMDMHEKSGLIDDLTDDNFKRHTLDRAWAMLTSESRQMRGGRGEFVHLAGLSIHFDKAFLDANDFHGLWGDEDDISPIHHRMLDLSSFKLMMKSAGLDSGALEVTNVNPHRAMADVAASIGFARNARNLLQTTGVTA